MRGAVAQLGEHLLCKQGVSGSIPLSSTILIHCFPIAAVLQERRRFGNRLDRSQDLVRQVSHRLRAGLLAKVSKVWMFDNEIDWVMRIKCASSYRRAARQAEGMRMTMTQLQGRAHCRVAAMRRMQVFKCKKSVFRSATRERVSVASCSQANYVG